MNRPVVTRELQSQSRERTPGLDLQIVVIFCLVGLLLTFLALRSPEFSGVMTQYSVM